MSAGNNKKYSGGKQSDLLAKFAQKKQEKACREIEECLTPKVAPEAEEKAAAERDTATPNPMWRSGGSAPPRRPDVDPYQTFDKMLKGDVDIDFRMPSEFQEQRRAAQEETIKAFQPGDFAPLDAWQALMDGDGRPVSFRMFGSAGKPLIVVADPRGGSGSFKKMMASLNTQLPRAVADVVAITPDTTAYNRRLVKKSQLWFPVLSDPDRKWMNAYLVTAQRPWDTFLFVLEPTLGKFLACVPACDALTVAELLRENLGGAWP